MNDIIKVINILNEIPEPFSVDGIIKTFEASTKDFVKSFAIYFHKDNTAESRLWYVSENKLVINEKENNREYILSARGNRFGSIIINTNKKKNEILILINYLAIILYSEKLSFLANRDKLTGLYNRGYIIKYLQEKETSDEIYSIVIIDLDKFKHYNDTYGHNIGDHVLKLASKVMKDSLKRIENKSVLARYGGEEFIVVFDIQDKNELFNAMEKIRKFITETDFSTEEYSLKATASLGGAIKEKNTELRTFINKADQSLYNAKETGRNKSVILDL
ncbi:GGDEF domain-containing protein [Brachyspira hampsonii 30446]|uniref:diguanylate cyclase n=2 Tax=Brachyspira hampsonii TaxID=1287055 RepID=A0A2U4F2P8_9SPIR|nr:GGDEF domain-containing protein [Brachyspira hampsonii]EKV56657.1 GGDEF domain-containing protein [Brachyspira hampsonii 30446]MBW5394234.1 GGDEF domain-containing protein [Brachyspira hampsonii]OEJ17312.1 diguanylate cyclase [Brachyspira hampsonii]